MRSSNGKYPPYSQLSMTSYQTVQTHIIRDNGNKKLGNFIWVPHEYDDIMLHKNNVKLKNFLDNDMFDKDTVYQNIGEIFNEELA